MGYSVPKFIPTSVHARIGKGILTQAWEKRVSASRLEEPEEWLKRLGLTIGQARDLCKADLYFLAREVLGYTFFYAPLHRPLARKYQEYHALSMWLIPRDHLKTTLFTISGSIQEVLIDPNVTILICSAKLENTRTIMEDIRRKFVECQKLRFLFPEYAMEEKDLSRWNEWNTPARTSKEPKECTFTGSSVDSSVVSKHFDIIKCDDLVDDSNVRTTDGMTRVKQFFRRLWPLLRPAIGRLVVVGTRWDQDDAYNMIEEDMTGAGSFLIRMKCWEKDDRGKLYSIFPETDYGQPMYSIELLKQRRRQMREYEFSCQFLNNPMPDKENRILHPDQVQWTSRIPDNCYNFIFCDPAISTREEADRFAILCIAVDWKGNLFVRDCIADQLSISAAAQWIYEFSTLYSPQFIMMESLAFQEAYRQHLETIIRQNGGDVVISEAPRKTGEEKVRRIFGLQPFFAERKIFFLSGGRGVQDVVDECLGYSKKMSKRQNDDIVDALSDAPLHAFAPARPQGFMEDWSVADHFANQDLRESSAEFGAMDFHQVAA